MRGVSTDIGVIHFVGIGGIGMSGIASIMSNLGYRVRGSDLSDSATVDRLRENGIDITIGHAPENVSGAAVVVISSAVERGNVEVEAALAQRIPVVRRAEMLAELMRLKSTVAVAGTHGKTTTTSMIAALLDAGGFDPTVINGGIINSYGSNAYLGAGDWMVVESDESDGSFLRLDGTLAVVTNIDSDHLDHWGNMAALRKAFVSFVENVPFYGAAIVCLDDPQVQAILPQISDRRIIGYGFSAQADVRATEVYPEGVGVRFDVTIRDREGASREIVGLRLPMPGRYNVQNALAAVAVAQHLHIDDAAIRRGFADFAGVKRRFTLVGEVACASAGTGADSGAGIAQIIDDYAHHPVEIAAVLAAARVVLSTRAATQVTTESPSDIATQSPTQSNYESTGYESQSSEVANVGRIIAVIQPHRFTRLESMMSAFATALHEADILLALPVYTAGEAPIAGATSQELVDLAQARGHRAAHLLPDAAALARWLADEIAADDMIICMGAGDITKIAAGLAAAIDEARR